MFLGVWLFGVGVALFIWSIQEPGVQYIPSLAAGVLIMGGVLKIRDN